jgi:hypothetical protein
MQTSRQVRCEQCGHESDAQYRFCGMCGSKLPEPQSEYSEKRVLRRPNNDDEGRTRRVSGPSFLGLADEPSNAAEYLLDEEESSSHWGRAVFLVLLLAGAAVAGWHWRYPLKDWAMRYVQQRPASATQASANSQDTSYKTSPISTSGSEIAGSLPNSAAIQQTQSPDSSVPTPQAPQASPQNPNEGEATSQPAPPQQGNASQQQTAQPAAEQPLATAQAPSTSPATVPTEVANSVAAPAAKADNTSAKNAKASSGEEDTPTATPVEQPGQALEAEGEKYLYGNGVPASCSHAQKDLLTAAQQSNSKAASVLGTMYATGHCTTRDLPLAYYWFAKAMQEDPSNSRVEHDLLLVWNQMTPDERQLAIHHR